MIKFAFLFILIGLIGFLFENTTINFIFISIAVICVMYHILKSDDSQFKNNRASMRLIDQMDGLQFEHVVANYFKSEGYSARVTQASNDFGADVIIKKEKKRTVIQCKRYKAKVGVAAVQQIVSAKAFYDATGSMVVTNSYFTDAAKRLAQVNGVILYDRDWCQKNLAK